MIHEEIKGIFQLRERDKKEAHQQVIKGKQIYLEKETGGGGEESYGGVMCYVVNLAIFFLVLVHSSQKPPSMKKDRGG